MPEYLWARGKYFKIRLEKLQQIQQALTGIIDPDDVADDLISYDWSNADEHQEWLDTAPLGEIVTWLRSFHGT